MYHESDAGAQKHTGTVKAGLGAKDMSASRQRPEMSVRDLKDLKGDHKRDARDIVMRRLGAEKAKTLLTPEMFEARRGMPASVVCPTAELTKSESRQNETRQSGTRLNGSRVGSSGWRPGSSVRSMVVSTNEIHGATTPLRIFAGEVGASKLVVDSIECGGKVSANEISGDTLDMSRFKLSSGGNVAPVSFSAQKAPGTDVASTVGEATDALKAGVVQEGLGGFTETIEMEPVLVNGGETKSWELCADTRGLVVLEIHVVLRDALTDERGVINGRFIVQPKTGEVGNLVIENLYEDVSLPGCLGSGVSVNVSIDAAGGCEMNLKNGDRACYASGDVVLRSFVV